MQSSIVGQPGIHAMHDVSLTNFNLNHHHELAGDAASSSSSSSSSIYTSTYTDLDQSCGGSHQTAADQSVRYGQQVSTIEGWTSLVQPSMIMSCKDGGGQYPEHSAQLQTRASNGFSVSNIEQGTKGLNSSDGSKLIMSQDQTGWCNKNEQDSSNNNNNKQQQIALSNSSIYDSSSISSSTSSSSIKNAGKGEDETCKHHSTEDRDKSTDRQEQGEDQRDPLAQLISSTIGDIMLDIAPKN